MSVPVVLASDQGSLAVSGSSISTVQALTVSATTKTESTTLDTDGFKRVGYIITAASSGTFVQLEWSHNASDWYRVESRVAPASVSDAEDTNSELVAYYTVDCLARYVRVGIYNSTAVSVGHGVIANRIA